MNKIKNFFRSKHAIPLLAFICFLLFGLIFRNLERKSPKSPEPITIDIDKSNTKIEYFTYSGVKEKELTKNSVTVQFNDNNSFELHSRSSKLPLSNSTAPVVISNGIKNYADIYAQDNLDFSSSKYVFLPIEFYKTFKSRWKDTNNTAVSVYAAPGKPIACFEGSHVSVSATAAKNVKEIHVDGHKAIIINSMYSIHKVGQLKDMYTRKIKIQKREAASN